MTSWASRLSAALLLLAAPAAANIAPRAFELPSVEPRSLIHDLLSEPLPEDVVPMPADFGDTGFRDYAALGERMEAAGQDFPAVFRAACALAQRRGGSAHETKVMLAGLVTWLGDRARPRAIGLLGRLDWAFHFTYGAWLESIAPGLGERAAFRKEERDAFAPGNGYDLGDLAVTLAGARWARREPARLGEWASGRRRLEDLPALSLPKLAHRALPHAGQVAAARDWAERALP
jgi:hypothetical protein